jgi:hypothetical protein
MKSFFLIVADLFGKWKDGSNDPGDLQSVSDAVADLIDGEFDDELDELLGKSIDLGPISFGVGTVLGFLEGLLRKLGS